MKKSPAYFIYQTETYVPCLKNINAVRAANSQEL